MQFDLSPLVQWKEDCKSFRRGYSRNKIMAEDSKLDKYAVALSGRASIRKELAIELCRANKNETGSISITQQLALEVRAWIAVYEFSKSKDI